MLSNAILNAPIPSRSEANAAYIIDRQLSELHRTWDYKNEVCIKDEGKSIQQLNVDTVVDINQI